MVAIIFDVDGVLIHGYHAKPQYRRMWADNLELDFGVKPETFTQEFILKSFQDVLVGKRSLYPALQEALPQMGYSGDIQDFIDYWLAKDACVNDELFEHVKTLSKYEDVSLYIATNQEETRAQYLMNTLNFKKYFIDIFNSSRIGCLKTDPLFYKRVEKEISQNIASVIYFDDSQDVVDAANKHGWTGYQFDTVKDLNKSPKLISLLNL